jgi:hypothetical protein
VIGIGTLALAHQGGRRQPARRRPPGRQGVLVGPILLLMVVPALQTLFLDWRSRREAVLHEKGPDLAGRERRMLR